MNKIRYKFSDKAEIKIIEEVMTPLIENVEYIERYEVERLNTKKPICKVLLTNPTGYIIIHSSNNCRCWNLKK